MPDNHYERDGRIERERTLRPADQMGPVSDREVPLAPVATPDVINRWLDGEMPEPTGLRGDAARSVEFWRRLGEETDSRRRVVTPPQLAARIMAALPPLEKQLDTSPWFRRELHLSATTLAAAGAALFTLGLVVARAFFR